MATFFADPAGSNTAPYDTEPKAANEVQTALAHFINNESIPGVIKVTPATYSTAISDLSVGSPLPADLIIEGTSLTNLPIVPSFEFQEITAAGIDLIIRNFETTGNITIREIFGDWTVRNCDINGVLKGNVQGAATTDLIINCRFRDQTTAIEVGVGVSAGGDITIENCVIDNNTVGILTEIVDFLTLKNNIISNNTTGLKISSSFDVVTSDWNLYFNNGTDIDNAAGGSFTSNNDYRTGGAFAPFDPKFINASADDYHLIARASLAIDAGDPASVFSNEPDSPLGRINLGRYGNTVEAALGIFPKSAETDAVAKYYRDLLGVLGEIGA